MSMFRFGTLIASFLILAGFTAEQPFRIRETGKTYKNLQAAVDAIGGGKATIEIAPGLYRQCAVQKAGSIAFVATRAGTAILAARACEGKASLVLRGRSASIHGLVFEGIRVPDENGAGIRLERGNLSVAESLFRNSQSGILAGNDAGGEIRVDRSTFSSLGFCASDCAHSIYIGNYGKLGITRSRFEQGTGGHYVKARARLVEITSNSFDDRNGRGTNYMIDLPNGAAGLITRNDFIQGRNKENYSTLIMIAAEGRMHPTHLIISGNNASNAPGVVRKTAFVTDMSGGALSVEQNRLGANISRLIRRH